MTTRVIHQKPTSIDEELRRNPLFAGLDNDQLARVKDTMRTVELKEGECLFNHGQHATRFFLVRSGQIKLYRLSGNLNDATLSFCPTQYRGFRRTQYIKTVSNKLRREIDIFWTGKNVVAKRITETEIDRINCTVKRPVLIWDNIFANDYIPGRILRFPYRNREPGIVEKVKGILINPMNNYQESKPLIHTAAQFFHDPFRYNPKKAWNNALNAIVDADFRHP